MFARFDGGHQVLWTEMRRSRLDHVVHLGKTHQLLIGVEAGETATLRNVDPEFLQLLLALDQSIIKQVGQGDDLHVGSFDLGPFGYIFCVVAGRRIDDLGGRAERVEHSSRAATTAADQANLDRHFGSGLRRMNVRQVRERGDPGESQGGLRKELSSVNVLGCSVLVLSHECRSPKKEQVRKLLWTSAEKRGRCHSVSRSRPLGAVTLPHCSNKVSRGNAGRVGRRGRPGGPRHR